LSRTAPPRHSFGQTSWGLRPARLAALLSTLAVLALPLVACGDDEATEPDDSQEPDQSTSAGEGYPRLEGEYEANCAGFTRRLRDCGLLTEGQVTCQDPTDPVEQCAFDCLSVASCSLLASSHCVGSAPALARCFSFCDYFTCDETLLIPRYYVCDRQADCQDGTDEADCDYFDCGSGDVVDASNVCNGFFECLDGSDEIDCPTFECPSGELIPVQWLCDFDLDCNDGADELGCEHIVCASDGEKLPASWRCDLEDDCLDGSDEWDCAQFLCR
jgi:hypothetical protein